MAGTRYSQARSDQLPHRSGHQHGKGSGAVGSRPVRSRLLPNKV